MYVCSFISIYTYTYPIHPATDQEMPTFKVSDGFNNNKDDLLTAF